MQRTIFTEDHHAFRASAKEYADRSLVPRMEQFLEERTIDRAAWLEAGKQGFLGLDVPQEYGGSSVGDYRFNAVFAEEVSKVSASLSSCLGITTTAPRRTWSTLVPRSRSSAGCRSSAPVS